MRWIYVIATLVFWIAVGLIWASSIRAPIVDHLSNTSPDRRIVSAAELARHARSDDCWMAIRGSVFDLTKYLPEHPSRPGILEPWCGKEATQAYETKTKGRRHSPEADRLLAGYRLGAFAGVSPRS